MHALDIPLTLEQRRGWDANSHRVENPCITLIPPKLNYSCPTDI